MIQPKSLSDGETASENLLPPSSCSFQKTHLSLTPTSCHCLAVCVEVSWGMESDFLQFAFLPKGDYRKKVLEFLHLKPYLINC